MPKCRVCLVRFKAKFRSTEKTCSPQCGWKYLQTEQGIKDTKRIVKRNAEEQAKAQRQKDRARKQALKTRGEWIKDLQTAFNRFIRLRDQLNNEPCISCGRYDHEIEDKWRGGKWDAGHYKSVGSAPELRFNEDNVHRQCKHCNNYLSGNHVEYRQFLVLRIGLERVEKLEGPHPPLKLSIDQIKELTKEYRARNRELIIKISEMS